MEKKHVVKEQAMIEPKCLQKMTNREQQVPFFYPRTSSKYQDMALPLRQKLTR